ncbi:MAG: pre-peptidase C-terminal domain-containing protein [Fimbriimonadaceae bacterium]|nr:pre-peptidase C-terminal domain-containing protein [Fimbriimonadaceae bacterium]
MLTTLLFGAAIGMAAQDLLPDITIWEDQLYDRVIDTTEIAGHKLLRFSTGTPNIGLGRLEIRGGAVNGNTQQVNQRIYRTDGTWWERQAGTFTYHAGHSHIHFDDWCHYRLKPVLPGGGVGVTLAEGSKTSFCILDLHIYDTSNPSYDPNGNYRSCGAIVQGLTPGWADVYSKYLADQWIDITSIPDGTYWLEVEVDPNNNLVESDETNNIKRIQVTIEAPPPLVPDAYEDNDTRAITDARPEGVKQSPNLGLVNALRVIPNLSVEDANDWYKFRMNNAGSSGDYIRMESALPDGDIDLELYNSSGTRLASSASATNTEQVSLSGRPAGTYYIRVFPYSGTNPKYTLTIEPAGNNPPVINVQEPVSGVHYVELHREAFPIAWTSSDPDGDPVTVGVFLHTNPTVFDKNTSVPVPGYDRLPGTDGRANVNTASLTRGLWYVFLKASDGGSTFGRYAPGAVVLYVKGDVNMDGVFDMADMDTIMRYLQFSGKSVRGRLLAGWRYILDANYDGYVDRDDMDIFERRLHG